jgi:hypothetical protein
MLPSGLEIELCIANLKWAATDPIDEGTKRVVSDGIQVLHDPKGLLNHLVERTHESTTG